MKVITFREFANDTKESVKEIFDFIGVDATIKVETGKKYNERDSFLANPQLYRVLYRAWSPVKSVLPEEVMDRLLNIRSAVRGFLFRSEEKPEMPPKARQYLSEVYETPNTQLQNWLGRDLSHWT